MTVPVSIIIIGETFLKYWRKFHYDNYKEYTQFECSKQMKMMVTKYNIAVDKDKYFCINNITVRGSR